MAKTWQDGYDDFRNYQWAIELKEIHEPIGSISAVKTDDRTGSATIGYCIGRNWWGRGITAEALREVIAFFFQEVGMNCVNACHDPRNPNSGKVMRKCGMTYEGTWRAGGVAAAVLSKTGNIYTGVCVDTCSTLGICAERNAIFHMLTNGEHEIEKVLAIMPDGHTGAPCGACRELMVQLMPDAYKDIEIMLDYERRRVVTLGELTPEWWI